MQIKASIKNFVLATSFILPLSTQAADWSDTEISLLNGGDFHEHSNDIDVRKTTLTLQHASGYKYGRNFFFVDALKSNSVDGKYGELYGEYYHTLSFTKVAEKDWSQNVLRDIGLTGGLNYGSKNSPYGPNPEIYLVGPTLDFNVPGFKFLNLDLLAYIDNSTHSGFGGGKSCGKTATTYQITPSWALPFAIGSTKFSFEGFLDLIGKHGTCEQQVIAQPQLRWDVGNYFGKSETIYLGVEYQYWNNKFGTKGLKDSFPQAMLAWKL